MILAIVLSTLVLLAWPYFFKPQSPPINKELNTSKSLQENNEISSPSIENETKEKILSRNDSLNLTKRISIENENISGSISLTGGIIDDISFKNYKEKLDSEERVVLLSPNNSNDGYYIETGWVSNSEKDLPNSKTEWSVIGNTKLTPNNSVTIEWTNKNEIKFIKTIEIDKKFLFKINQKIQNDGNNTHDFYPYAQIIRNKKPEVSGFIILHEGFIGVFDQELKEEDYKDIEEKRFEGYFSTGWLGITD